ncbi:MAG TPA: sugar ABC transporter substrate-binding protein [Thermomicrobiales bacterium]|nr:sugar ABC transporter substrate-binding protein [Thermomicrobiales bacterium]
MVVRDGSPDAPKVSLQSTPLTRRQVTKGLALAGTAAFVSALAPGASRAAAQGEKVTITYATPAGGGQPEIDLYDKLISQFEQANPNITVKQQVVPATSDPEFWQKLQVMAAANEYPDLSYAHYSWFPQAVKVGYLRDLGSDIASSDLKPDAYFPTTTQQFTSDGKLYALPRETSSIALFYNSTMLSAAKVPSPNDLFAQGKWTWDEFRSVAKELTDSKTGQWGAIAPVDMPYSLFSVLYSFGGGVLNDDNTKSMFTSAEDIQALTYLQQLVADKTAILPGQAQQLNLFANGKIGMYASGYWDIAANIAAATSFDWDVAPLPKGTVQATRAASGGYAIPAKAKHPDEAWKLLQFLSSVDSTTYLASLGLIIPALKAVAESPDFLQPNAKPAHRKVFVDALAYGKLDPEIPQWAEMITIIGNETDKLWLGQQTPDETGKSIDSQLNQLLQRG